MTTSTSSGLSAEAKEFIPSFPSPPTIPVYIDENTITSIYPTEPPPPSLIYPLIKIPEIEFHLSSSSSTNDNTSQIILLPSNGCYPGTPISTYYPISSFPLQHNNHHSSFQKTNRNHTSRQKNDSIKKPDSSFKLRTEDFPSLPNSQPPLVSTESK